MTTTESLIERDLIEKLKDLKYTYREDIRDRASLEANFRSKFGERYVKRRCYEGRVAELSSSVGHAD